MKKQAFNNSEESQAVTLADQPTTALAGLNLHPGEGWFWSRPDRPAEWICQEFQVYRLIGDAVNSETYLIEFINRHQQFCQLYFPCSDLIGGKDKLLRRLADQAFPMSLVQAHLEQLANLLCSLQPTATRKAVNRPGWDEGTFVHPDLQQDPKAQQTVLIGGCDSIARLRSKGTPAEYRDNIGWLCRDNPYLTFALSHGFSAVLRPLLGMDPCGLHFYGLSSTGKSSLGKVANSVFGHRDRIRSWNTTVSGMERLLRNYRHQLLVLDEMDQVPPGILGCLLYEFGNGRGRTLATGTGEPLETTCISTGERSVEEILTKQGLAYMDGQRARMINLPVPGCQGGVIANLHGYPNPGSFLEALTDAADHNFGTSARLFINWLLDEDLEEHRRDFAYMKETFLDSLGLPAEAGLQRRVASQFAFTAFAGTLASISVIPGWRVEEPWSIAREMFRLWAADQISPSRRKLNEIVVQLQNFVLTHSARIVDRHAGVKSLSGSRTPLGFKVTYDDCEYLCLQAPVFTEQALRGFDPQEAIPLLIEAKILVPNRSDGTAYQSIRFPEKGGSRSRRGYRLRNLMDWQPLAV